MTVEPIVTQKILVEGFLMGFGTVLKIAWPYLLIMLALALLSRWVEKKIKIKKKRKK